MLSKLTERQREIFHIVQSDPRISIREICEKVGLRSTSSVHEHLRTLQKAGLAFRKRHSQRGLYIQGPDFCDGKGSILEELREENDQLRKVIESSTLCMLGEHRLLLEGGAIEDRPPWVIVDTQLNELRCRHCSNILCIRTTSSVQDIVNSHKAFNNQHKGCKKK